VRDGIVVVEIRGATSVSANLMRDSRSFVSRVECNPAPKSRRRRDRTVKAEVRNDTSYESGVARIAQSSFSTGRKCGRKDLPTLTSLLNI
jgi:hypothetical protein